MAGIDTRPRRGRRRAARAALAAAAMLLAACVPGPALASVHPAAYRTEFQAAAGDGDRAAQLHCLALNVYHEARNEPPAGQFAVAMVTLHRARDPSFPSTVCRVVWQPGQFSWTHDGEPDRPYEQAAWHDALRIAKLAYWYRWSGSLGRATHYHTVDVRPAWAEGRRPLARIGRHLFYAL